MSTAHRLACSLFLMFPALALAHPGHDLTASVAAGLLHPLTGLDHLLAMVATGVWAAHLGKRAALILPLAFVAAMTLGSALPTVGVSLPAIEPMISLSVVVLGALIAVQVRINAALGAVLVALFAIFHGYAHATESAASAVPFALGFAVMTSCLSGVGAWLGTHLHARSANMVRIVGSLIGASGALLLIG